MFPKRILDISWPSQPGKIIRWLVGPGSRVQAGTRLARCDPDNIVISSPAGGVVLKLFAAAGSRVSPRELVVRISPARKSVDYTSASLGPVSKHVLQRMPLEQIQKLYEDSIALSRLSDLIRTRRLALILDLDMTILHSCVIDRAPPGFSVDQYDNVFQFKIEGELNYYVKFRPGCVDFLRRVSEFFEIHVYTMGTREYAKAILDIIEKMVGKQLIEGKVLTRCDTGVSTEKSIQSILPGLETMTLILDDRVDIWETSKNNLVPIYPYKFFLNLQEMADNNNNHNHNINNTLLEDRSNHDLNPLSETNSVTSVEKDIDLGLVNNVNSILGKRERPPEEDSTTTTKRQKTTTTTTKKTKKFWEIPDTHLSSMLDVMKDVHKQFFTYIHKTTDVTEHLRWRQGMVLSGVHIVFSAMFPLDIEPEEQMLWRQAENFGAKCYKTMNPSITHLVAAREGTEKVLEAVQHGSIFIVTPSWLYDSLAHWVRLEEKHFSLFNFPCCVGEPPKIKSLGSDYPYNYDNNPIQNSTKTVD